MYCIKLYKLAFIDRVTGMWQMLNPRSEESR